MNGTLQTVETWLYNTLTQIIAVGGSRVYAHQAPQDAAFPYIIFQPMSGIDLNALTARGGTDFRILIKAVNEGESFPVNAFSGDDLAANIDELLQGVSDTQDGVLLRWKRVQTIEYTETRAGKRYNHTGGIYRCFAG